MNTVDRFVASVRRTIEARSLLNGGEYVLLAVSGGTDSFALLHVFHRIAPELDLTLHVAHFDHRWRAGSADDAAFVRRQAARLGIGCTTGEAETLRIPGQSPEEGARTLRLRFLNETAAAIGATRIATGHTLDDQAETVLMRVLVGAGKRGLGGIPPTRWYTIRPLIDMRRADTEAFCKALRLRPRLDPSNEDVSLLRNMLRLQTLPVLRETINERLDEQLARMADIARDEDHYLDAQAAALAKPEPTPEGSRLSTEALLAMPVALQRRAIRLLARNEGPGIDAEHTEVVRALARTGRTGTEVHLPGSLRARIEYGWLVVAIESSSERARAEEALAVPGETDLVSWGLHVRAWLSDAGPAFFPADDDGCVLDADRISFPLRVRRWRQGDTFRPLGMQRRKKVGDFFTDERVPGRKRKEVPLVVSSDEQIVWIAGHRIDDRAKVTERTRSFLHLALERG